MKTYDPRALARKAVAEHFGRPAMALMHDSPDVALVIFRVAPGQSLPRHASPSTVLLYVLSGCGLVSGVAGEHAVHAGEVIAYEPRETHEVRAISEELVLLAIIAPRPSSRSSSSEATVTETQRPPWHKAYSPPSPSLRQP
jgi:quercetin dioxygenase-like cupin family protein